MINKWIKEKMDTNKIKYELIYKMSKNGSKPKDFHKCCDNKGATLTLIETKSKHIFGGFTPVSWNSNDKKFKDIKKETFLFSLNLMKKYNMLNIEKSAIVCYKEHGPSFGNGTYINSINSITYYRDIFDIDFYKGLSQGTISAFESSNFFEFKQLELTEGKGMVESFYTKEIEVFKVILE